MGGSVLPATIDDKGVLRFLFGKERDIDENPGWSDFGGGTENGETYMTTAIREGGEELTGFLGGEKEITAVQSELSEEVFGVVSTTAAYLMNNQNGYTDATHPPIAVSGRVPVKVLGKVKKGQRLVASLIPGCASAGVPHSNDVFGIALESSDDVDEKLIEAVIL